MKTNKHLSILLFFLVILISCTENSGKAKIKNVQGNVVDNISFSYKGVSFDYPDNWKVEKEEIQKDLAYQINCEKKGFDSADAIFIQWFNIELEPREYIELMIESMKEQPTHKNANIKPIHTTIYKGSHAVRTDFELKLFGEMFYGQITAYNSNNKAILIMKQTDSIFKLDSEFKVIENSLIIE